jgi:leader peptidase (prepilin peptidase) / N-methyltransferase
MTVGLAFLVGLLGVVAGWYVGLRADAWAPRPVAAGSALPAEPEGDGPVPARPWVALATGVLFALTALRFGPSWQLPAFLHLAAVGVLLALIDLRHRLLPNRIVVPSLAVGAVLLVLPAVADGAWPALFRAALGAAGLFAGFLLLALLAPSGLGMGDVKLAALIGLHLGWLGAGEVVLGAVAGFAVQAVLALVLLASRRIGLRGELPFGPAMLVGAALAIGCGTAVLAG